jgi:hypothetical protein
MDAVSHFLVSVEWAVDMDWARDVIALEEAQCRTNSPIRGEG